MKFRIAALFMLTLPAFAQSRMLSVMATPTGATLTWTNPNTSPTTINVYRCSGIGCTNFTLIASSVAAAGPYSDSTVLSGSYSYQIKALAADGVTLSPASNTATYTLAPLAPTGLTAQ